MASEIVADADAQIVATLQLALEDEARVGLVAPKFYREVMVTGPTMAHKIPKHPSTADSSAITDGTALGNTAIAVASVTVTCAGVGLAGDVTDQSAEGSALGVLESIANFTRALVNKMDADGCGILDNFSTTVGTSNADLTIGNLLSAYYSLLLANEMRSPVYVLHPIQYLDAASAIVASAAPVFGAQNVIGGFMGFQPNDPNFRGTFMGIPVYTSSNVPSVNSDADRGGALFSAGRALVWGWKWMPRAETIRTIKLPGTSIAVTACYGVAEVHDGAGVSIITDHE